MSLSADRLWYREAVFYEVPVQSFQDGNDDGIGDFVGLARRLPYIKSLGVDCLWLLPFYPSPLKDSGYDVADYLDIHPSLGTLADFDHFLHEAHELGIRVLADLVMNHTSDQHPWFQAARADRNSPFRDYYVWSDTPDRYQDARIIFTDTEVSNWTWDPVAGQYFWHRFFSHQPDLKFENPAVRQAMKDIMAFWLERGLDGFRLDAVPYLFEAEGTNCENLPQTHAYLKELRAWLDQHYPGRFFLAEANQPPRQVVDYFGDGDECHMAFNFPLMPRLFIALRREVAAPIREVLLDLPEIPEGCQWATFLRNHDELTLEMVTPEEREYMYGEYATDPRARLNVGIRRRLAPLVSGGRRQIELLTSLLLSLGGSPVLYYGDEIGMGDNLYLGDRTGVRTPMQWTGDRNAGFSRAPALAIPVNTDPLYGYQAVNVEAQDLLPTSLLNWTRRIIAVRQKHPAFARGELEFLSSSSPAILSYLRRLGDDLILCVANMSRYVRATELDLARYAGYTPIELIGETALPPIGELPYFLTLGPHTFYWMRLAP